MAEMNGIAGDVTFATGYVANVKSWTMNVEADMFDITDFTSTGWKNNLAGLKGWSGSYVCWVDDTTQMDANANWLAGTAAAATFNFDGTRTLSGNIIISGLSTGASVDGVAEVTFNFTGDGALTVN